MIIKSIDELRLTKTYSITRITTSANDSQPKRNYGKWIFNGWDEYSLSFVDSFDDDGVELLLPRGKDEEFGSQWKIKLVKEKPE